MSHSDYMKTSILRKHLNMVRACPLTSVGTRLAPGYHIQPRSFGVFLDVPQESDITERVHEPEVSGVRICPAEPEARSLRPQQEVNTWNTSDSVMIEELGEGEYHFMENESADMLVDIAVNEATVELCRAFYQLVFHKE